MPSFRKFLKGLFHVTRKAEPEPASDDPCHLLEPRIGLTNIPLSAKAFDYHRKRMSCRQIFPVARCACHSCQNYAIIPQENIAPRNYNRDKYAIKFAPIKYRKVKGDPEISFDTLDKAFEFEFVRDSMFPNDFLRISRRVKRVHLKMLLRIVTYVKPEIGKLSPKNIHDLVISCCEFNVMHRFEDLKTKSTAYFYGIDLTATLNKYGSQMSKDFTRKIMILFVQTWHAFSSGNRTAEFSAFRLRRFLTHILCFPPVAAEVLETITTPEFWPEVGPVAIFELLFEQYLCCTHTASLLCNLTRIPGVADYLNSSTNCIYHLRNNQGFAKALTEEDELGVLLLNLAVNLAPCEGFPKFFMENLLEAVVLPLVKVSLVESPMEKAVWVLLRNFVMTEEGREYVMENLSEYLELILYPIAGPEELTSEEMSGLPLELKSLMETKERVQDKRVRESILDIIFMLCRFKEDREKLRNAKTSVILKYYQLAEKDTRLLEKIQMVIGLLTPKEAPEIEVDDLLKNVSLEDQTNQAATSGLVIIRPTDAFP